MNKKPTFVLKLLLGLTLIFFIFSKIEWNEFLETLNRINLIFICIPIILFFFPSLWLSVIKWTKLLSVHNINLPFKDLYLYYLIGTFFNNFLPSTVGGDVSRVAYLKTATNKPAEIAASIVMERLNGLIALVFLCLFSFILNPSFIHNLIALHSLVIIFIALLAFLLTVSIYSFLRFGKNAPYIPKFRILTTLQAKIAQVFNAIYYYRHFQSTLIETFLLSIAFILFAIFANYLYFLSIGIKVPILELIQIYTIVRLISLLPISINSLGITEGLYIVLFGLIGISSVDALTVALLGRVLLMLVSLSGGFVFILQDKLFTNTH